MKTPLRLVFLAVALSLTIMLFVTREAVANTLNSSKAGSFTQRLYDFEARLKGGLGGVMSTAMSTNPEMTDTTYGDEGHKKFYDYKTSKEDYEREKKLQDDLKGLMEEVKKVGEDMGKENWLKTEASATIGKALEQAKQLVGSSKVIPGSHRRPPGGTEKASSDKTAQDDGASLDRLDGSQVKSVGSLPDRVVIMGKMHYEDTDWVLRDLPDWQHAIYIVDPTNKSFVLPPNSLVTPANKGREAMAYLTYVIDNYEKLPSVLAFIHPHRDGYPAAWHTDAAAHSNVASLTTLRLDYIEKVGYANLRCNTAPGCPAEVRPYAPESTKEPEAHMAQAWRELFPAGDALSTVANKSEIPQVFGAACCAQFAASAAQVRQRPLAEYIHFRDWILETEMTDYVSGRVFEYLWHVIFGRNAVDCPTMRDCYCNVYGRRCKGQPGSVSRGPEDLRHPLREH